MDSGLFTSKGLLNRAHAYKAAVEANLSAGKGADDTINTGLYNYPVLMAADILLFETDVVPVGLDQRQHLEIVRDIAVSVNARLGKVLKVPEALIHERVMTIPGLDGRKMSKNYRNTIPIFADSKTIRRQVMRIVTDSKHPDAPKNPDKCNVFALCMKYPRFSEPDVIRINTQMLMAPPESEDGIELEKGPNIKPLPLTFTNSADYDHIEQGDELEIKDARHILRQGIRIQVTNQTKNETCDTQHTLSKRQIEMILEGSLINVVRKRQNRACFGAYR